MLRLSLCLCLSLSLCLCLGLGLMLLLLLLLRDCLCLSMSMSSQRVHSQRCGLRCVPVSHVRTDKSNLPAPGPAPALAPALEPAPGLAPGPGPGPAPVPRPQPVPERQRPSVAPGRQGPRRLSGARCESHEGDASYTHACARARRTTKHPIVLSPVCGKTGKVVLPMLRRWNAAAAPSRRCA